MLLTITTRYKPATDLGFLLHKHPDKFQSVNLSIGQAHIFYPESSEDKTTVALLLDIDPILIRKLFEPLGYQVKLQRHILDEKFPEWGYSKYFTVELFQNITLQELLSHLYVLIPVLDNEKHYYVNQHEIDKLLEKGRGWLANHPEKEQITKRYLINLRSFSRQALERLNQAETPEEIESEENTETKKRKESLNKKRLSSVLEQLQKSGAVKVIDLGCGEGKLLRMLLKNKQFQEIAGMDVSYSELSKAKDRLHWDELAPKQRERLQLFQGSLTYKDTRLEGYDAAAIIEVIEHLDENRLQTLERVVFEFAKPKTVVLTTPNAEYNVIYNNIKTGAMRHHDHRFEWTRKEFESWAKEVAQRNNYQVNFLPVGDVVEGIGAPTQMGIFMIDN